MSATQSRRAPAALPPDIVRMRRATRLLLAALVLALLLAAAWRAVQDRFALAGIRVSGELNHSNPAMLRANVLPHLRGNFFTLDLQQARQAFESVPWVRQAWVQREFPNWLRVRLTEHQPVAIWGVEDEGQLLNTEGEVFMADGYDAAPEAWPHLSGPSDQSAGVLQMWRLLQTELAGLGVPLRGLHLSERGSWRVSTQNGGVIELGRGGLPELRERVRRFMATLHEVTTRQQRHPGRDLISADLRYAEGYALRLRGVTTASPPSTSAPTDPQKVEH